MARHSYATVLKREGIPTALISELLSHDSEQTAKIYLQGFGDDFLDTASKSVI